MFSRLAGSLERIQYQHQSPLFHEVTALCQEAFDAITGMDKYATFDEDHLQTAVNKILIQMSFLRRFELIVRTRLNLNISECVIIQYPAGIAAIACGFRISKTIAIYNNPLGYTRGAGSSLSKEYHDLISTLVAETNSVDGTLRANIEQYYLTTVFLSTGLFTEGRGRPDVGTATAAEIASIFLHELGHAMTFLDQLCIAFSKAAQLRAVIQSINKQLTGDDLKTFRATIRTEANRINDAETKRMVLIVLAQLDRQSKLSYDQALAIYTTTMVALVFAGATYADDVMGNDSTSAYFERIADEWLSQHGAAADFTSYLNKTSKVEKYGRTQMMIQLMQASRVLNLWLEKISLLKNFGIYEIIVVAKKYDPQLRRMTLLIQNTAEELKAPNLPPELRDELIAIVRRGREAIADYQNRKISGLESFWTSLLRICRPGVILNTLVGGTLAADYQRLQELTKNLVQNPFGYHAARLQALQNKTST